MGKVLIYCTDRNKWWKPNYAGYTEYKCNAGIFEYEEAHKKYPDIGYKTKGVGDYFVDISEKEVEEINLRKEFIDYFELSPYMNLDSIDINKIKKFKALEIIQSKDFIDLQLLRKCKSAYEYNRKVASKYAERGNDIGLIHQEEFDLLKEVEVNEKEN